MANLKAVFLDRDGVINKKRIDHVKNISELEILSNVADSIKKLKKNGFLVLVITNQSAINRGLTSHQKIKKIHFAIQRYLRKNGTIIDDFFYCPHRPDEYCECRKPKPGMIFKAAQKYGIDLKNSWLIGDSEIDIQAGRVAGCKVIQINKKLKLPNAVQQIIESNS